MEFTTILVVSLANLENLDMGDYDIEELKVVDIRSNPTLSQFHHKPTPS